MFNDDIRFKNKVIQNLIEETKERKFSDSHSLARLILESIYNHNSNIGEVKSERESNGGYFKYIPYNREEFISLIINVQRIEKKKRFIDVGSGIGDKVILAYLFGDFELVTGVESNITTHHVSKYFIGDDAYFSFEKTAGRVERKKRAKKLLLNVDAFDYDFSENDFIYMYVPISSHEIMSDLHIKILKEMPEGGVAIDVGDDLSRDIKKMRGKINKKENRGWGRNYYKKIGKNEFLQLKTNPKTEVESA